jgi:Family of unknown function (DUF5683)
MIRNSILSILLLMATFGVFAQMPPDSVLQKKPNLKEKLAMAEAASDSLSPPAQKNKLLSTVWKKTEGVRNVFNFKKDYPSPKRAAVLSAIVPGLGQVYNKKYWKLPLVYGTMGTMVYFISVNRSEYKAFAQDYRDRLDEDPGTIDRWTSQGINLSTESIRSIRDDYRKRTEMSYIGLVFSYLLTGVDAYVDAHLLRFDVSDDLSMQLQPHYEYTPFKDGGMGLSLTFQPSSKEKAVYPISF